MRSTSTPSPALSGSGPAYQFLIMEALADAGVARGLARANWALTLVAQTVLGRGPDGPFDGPPPRPALRDDVTTPAGCTIAGLLMLEDGRIRSVLARAVEEATKTAAPPGRLPGEDLGKRGGAGAHTKGP